MPNSFLIFLFRIIPNFILRRIVAVIPGYNFMEETRNSQTPITFDYWYNQKIKGHHRNVYWPVHVTSKVDGYKNIYCGIETCPGYSSGCYVSAFEGKIYIGDYTQIAPNVGIFSVNHDVYDNRKYIAKDVKIGKYCWLGMGAIILPGVELGDFTIVGAGAIVTKSFPEGYCIIGGNPAIKIKDLEKENCVRHTSRFEYNGYIPSGNFEKYRKENLNV